MPNRTVVATAPKAKEKQQKNAKRGEISHMIVHLNRQLNKLTVAKARTRKETACRCCRKRPLSAAARRPIRRGPRSAIVRNGRSQKPHSDNRTTTDIDVRPFGATVEKKTKGEKTDAETGEFRHNRVLTYPKDKHFDPNTAYFGKISEHRRTTRPKTRKTEGGPSAALRCIRSTGRNRKIPYFI